MVGREIGVRDSTARVCVRVREFRKGGDERECEWQRSGPLPLAPPAPAPLTHANAHTPALFHYPKDGAK